MFREQYSGMEHQILILQKFTWIRVFLCFRLLVCNTLIRSFSFRRFNHSLCIRFLAASEPPDLRFVVLNAITLGKHCFAKPCFSTLLKRYLRVSGLSFSFPIRAGAPDIKYVLGQSCRAWHIEISSVGAFICTWPGCLAFLWYFLLLWDAGPSERHLMLTSACNQCKCLLSHHGTRCCCLTLVRWWSLATFSANGNPAISSHNIRMSMVSQAKTELQLTTTCRPPPLAQRVLP